MKVTAQQFINRANDLGNQNHRMTVDKSGEKIELKGKPWLKFKSSNKATRQAFFSALSDKYGAGRLAKAGITEKSVVNRRPLTGKQITKTIARAQKQFSQANAFHGPNFTTGFNLTNRMTDDALRGKVSDGDRNMLTQLRGSLLNDSAKRERFESLLGNNFNAHPDFESDKIYKGAAFTELLTSTAEEFISREQLTPRAQTTIDQAALLSDSVNDILANSAFEPDQIGQQIGTLMAKRTDIGNLLGQLPPAGANLVADQARTQLQATAANIDAAIGSPASGNTPATTGYLQDLQSSHAVSEAEVNSAFDSWDGAANIAFDILMMKKGVMGKQGSFTTPPRTSRPIYTQGRSNVKFTGSLKELENQVKGHEVLGAKHKARLQKLNFGPLKLGNAIGTVGVKTTKLAEPAGYKTDLQNEIKRQCDTHGIPVTREEVKAALKEARIEYMNTGQNWTTLDKHVRFTDSNGQQHDFQSLQIPAVEIGNADFARIYGGGPNAGICSYSTSSEHANNVWNSELKNDAGNTIFRGIRHGVFSAVGIKDVNARATANVNRAKETVAAAFAADPNFAQMVQDSQAGNTPTVMLGSVSLLTPDFARHAAKPIKDMGDERGMIKDQFGAWNSINGTTISIDVKDPANPGSTVAVNVNVDVMPFNFGVAAEAFNGANIGKTLIGARERGNWSVVQKQNQASMDTLMQRVDTFCNPLNSHSTADQELVRTLADQVTDIWESKDYQNYGNEAYKLPARIAVLMDKLGGTPCFNCKSGKDRTGMLDAEAKYLASQIDLKGEVPVPDHKLDSTEKQMLSRFVTDSGQLEIQKFQAGIGGTKAGGIKRIKDRLAGNSAYEAGVGGSKAASN